VSGVRFLPEVMINKVVFKGSLDPENVFQALCASFKDEPMYCKRFAPLTPMEELIALLTLAAMFCFVICLNFFFIYLSNRMRKRMIQEDSKKLVQDYMSIHSSDDTESKSSNEAPKQEGAFSIE
jgi:hypothetical protein